MTDILVEADDHAKAQEAVLIRRECWSARRPIGRLLAYADPLRVKVDVLPFDIAGT